MDDKLHKLHDLRCILGIMEALHILHKPIRIGMDTTSSIIARIDAYSTEAVITSLGYNRLSAVYATVFGCAFNSLILRVLFIVFFLLTMFSTAGRGR